MSEAVVGSAIAIQRTTFATSRTLEFCSAKELVAQTGHEPAEWPLVIIRELIDNALDACEEAGMAPFIRVTVARGRIRVRDNGPGIPSETVASILDFTTRTTSREAYVAPDRGRQGNVLKTVLAMPLALSGDEGRVEIVARGIPHEIIFRVDRIAQRPVVEHRQHCLIGVVRAGTAITVHWPDSASSDLEAAGRDFLPLVARSSGLNPHLSICATWLDAERRGQWRLEAINPGWSKWTPAAPTSPHWYRVADLERLAGAFLSHDRERKTVRVLRDFLTQFDGLSGTAERKTVLEEVGLQRAAMDRLLLEDRDEFNHALVGRLLAAMQAATRPIKPKALAPVGKDTVDATFSTWQADPETYRYKMFTGDDYSVPWIVETAMACLPEGRPRELLSGINWSPASKDPFDLGFKLGNSWCGPFEPIILLIHLICPRPEFRDRGKSRIASDSPGVAGAGGDCPAITGAIRATRRTGLRSWAMASSRSPMPAPAGLVLSLASPQLDLIVRERAHLRRRAASMAGETP